MHTANDELAAATAGLTYPFASTPDPGHALRVAPGVMWLRMPLPFTGLNHINLWALEDGAGWTLTDTGMQTPDTAAHWEQAFAGALDRRPVMRVICTHMHPDHIGMAGWLTRQNDCRLWTTRLEYLTCRMLVARSAALAPTTSGTRRATVSATSATSRSRSSAVNCSTSLATPGNTTASAPQRNA